MTSAGDPKDQTRFRYLTVTLSHLTGAQLDVAVDFGTNYLGEPEWRDEDSVGWTLGGASIVVRPNKGGQLLTMTVVPA